MKPTSYNPNHYYQYVPDETQVSFWCLIDALSYSNAYDSDPIRYWREIKEEERIALVKNNTDWRLIEKAVRESWNYGKNFCRHCGKLNL